MKIKTSDLTGAALDWAVAKCEGEDWFPPDPMGMCPMYMPSKEWDEGGPIIEREKIELSFDGAEGGVWAATFPPGNRDEFEIGPTALIAAMRCYVASVQGDEVDVPKELMP